MDIVDNVCDRKTVFFVIETVTFSKDADLLQSTAKWNDKSFSIYVTPTLKKKIRRYRHNCGSLTYIILEIHRKPRFAWLVQPVCVFQTYELLLQQYFWLTVKCFLLNYLKTISYIHMADKSQAFLSVYSTNQWEGKWCYWVTCSRAKTAMPWKCSFLGCFARGFA